jgi:hypothetical protein
MSRASPAVLHSRGNSVPVSADDPALAAIAEQVAVRESVPVRALRLQMLLHLPRVAGPGGRVPVDLARSETTRVARLVPASQEWTSGRGCSGGDWRVRATDEVEARPVLERFHYLRSFRENSRYFGLYDDSTGCLVALASTSVNDVQFLGEIALRNGVAVSQSRVVSRVFGFPAAPRNAISMLLGHVGRFERKMGNRMLLTYVNPNLGFSGGSYRASNWALADEQPGTAYDYIDGDYVTGRALHQRYGTDDPVRLSQVLEGRYARSEMLLRPLLVFSIGL